MRALLLTPDFPPARGGIQQVSARLAELLPGENRVVALGAPAAGDAALAVRRARSPRPSGPPAVAALNAAAVREGLAFRPDAILSLHLFTAPAAALLARTLGRPWVQYVYAMEVPQKPALARFALRRADAVIAISRYTEALALAAGADRERITIIPPGVDAAGRDPRAERLDRPTVVTVSRLAERYKGHDTMIRAMGLVSARVPGAQWVALGDGPLRGRLEALAAAQPGNGIRFEGPADDATRDWWLDRSHVFAMPSRLPGGGGAGEGFGIVYLEAGQHRLPVVAGDAGGARDAVIHGETGLLVDPTDHVAVADALAALLADPERADRMGTAGAAHASRLEWPAVAARVGDLLRDVVRSR